MPHPRTDNSKLGVLLMSLAAFLWVLHDAISKWLLQDYSIYQVLLLRTVFSLLPIVIVLRHEGGIVRLRGARVWVCLGRGYLAVACFVLFLAALPLMPLTDIFAIVMSAPLLISALSALVLKERVTFRRWVAILIGFAAVLVMVRPGGDVVSPGALLVVGAVVVYSFTMILTRRLGSTESAGAMTFYSALVFLAVGLIAAPFAGSADADRDAADGRDRTARGFCAVLPDRGVPNCPTVPCCPIRIHFAALGDAIRLSRLGGRSHSARSRGRRGSHHQWNLRAPRRKNVPETQSRSAHRFPPGFLSQVLTNIVRF